MTPPKNESQLDDLASEPDEGTIEAIGKTGGDIAVGGAGGKMGFHLCLMLRRALDAAGKSNRVFALSRFGDPAKREPFESRGIETVSCDLTQEQEYGKLPEAAAAYYLAGMKFGTSDSPETLRLFNEEMPALFARHYAACPIVALSTGCVYPFVSPDSGGSIETDSPEPAGDYANSCLGRERAFENASRENGTPIALIRLNYSVDLRYGVLVDIAYKMFHEEPIDVSMGYLNCIWQGDATRHIAQSLSLASPAPDPFILNVTGSRILKVRDIAEWFADRFGKSAQITGDEADTAWLNNAEKSHRLFGPPDVSEDTLLEWVASWMESGNPLLGKPTHFEVRDGKY